jgi:hypothetical protein
MIRIVLAGLCYHPTLKLFARLARLPVPNSSISLRTGARVPTELPLRVNDALHNHQPWASVDPGSPLKVSKASLKGVPHPIHSVKLVCKHCNCLKIAVCLFSRAIIFDLDCLALLTPQCAL